MDSFVDLERRAATPAGKGDSRDPELSAAREATRPRPRKASARSGKSTIKFNKAKIIYVSCRLDNKPIYLPCIS
ncbi:MAG: hypothetical protein ACE3JN_00130 [Ectobacillus sp.]